MFTFCIHISCLTEITFQMFYCLCLRWAGHLARRDDGRWTRAVTELGGGGGGQSADQTWLTRKWRGLYPIPIAYNTYIICVMTYNVGVGLGLLGRLGLRYGQNTSNIFWILVQASLSDKQTFAISHPASIESRSAIFETHSLNSAAENVKICIFLLLIWFPKIALLEYDFESQICSVCSRMMHISIVILKFLTAEFNVWLSKVAHLDRKKKTAAIYILVYNIY